VAVTPADFELYSRATGTPMPRTPQEQMQMAPQVYQFIQNRGYQQEGFFDSALGRGLRNAAIIGGAYALGNAFKGRKTDPPTPPSGGSGAVSIPVSPTTPLPPTLDPNSGGMSPSGVRPSGGNPPVSPQTIEATWEDQGREMPVVQELVTPTGNIEIHRYDPDGVLTTQPKTPVSRENVGTTGSLTRDLNNQIDRSNVWDGGASPTVVVGDRGGFGPAPAPRSEVEGIRDMEFSMKPPINRDPSFFNPTGSWGVGDTANLLGATINFGVENAPRMAAQGYYDIAKGARDLQKGYDDVKTVVGSVYDAGAATRGWHDRNLVPAGKRIAGIFMAPGLPTSASQQSDGIETGNASILFDHPDVVQSGTGSDEVQNNRNYILQGNVDLEGKPITVGEFDSAYPAETYTDHRKFGVGGGGINYLNAGNRFSGDPESFGKVPSQRVKDAFISSAGIPQIEEELVGGSVEQPSSGGNIVTNLFDKAKALYDENTQIANEIAREQEVEAAAQNVLNDMYSSGGGGGYEAYQEFEPKKSKTGGGSGVKSLAYDNRGNVVVDYWDRNPEKQTPGGYVSDSYQGAITGDARDELVTNTANPSLMSGNMTQEQMDDYQSLVADEMDGDETYQAGLRGGRFGRGEGQVSAGKFANAIKKDQKTALEFLKENSDTLRGI